MSSRWRSRSGWLAAQGLCSGTSGSSVASGASSSSRPWLTRRNTASAVTVLATEPTCTRACAVIGALRG